ncbi:uncharacterized protein LOC116297322 [Actinia tenebrosa]|uniref:Uncharacterized protein LOC116297322 n=1 Tax=Actinia tenebrosa TaxID=6105 RepID=A0A6P8I0Z6_ACTTE|nr:uncharacterized protein LOC116297322 [Actinia tenebrosa]
MGSNACTIIAVIWAMKFLSGTVPVPSPHNILSTVAAFANSMREGNILYNNLNLPVNQPNLNVQEALATRYDKFGLTMIEDSAVFSPACLKDKLILMTISSGNKCAIIIAPPDKSMLLCFSSREQKVSLFESHSHGNQGGLLAIASYEQIDSFVLFLEYMCLCDWVSSISGANISVVQ